MGDQPSHKIIRKKADGTGWEHIGACWEREDGKLSATIELVRGGEKVKALIVKNEPRKTHEASRMEDTKPIADNFGDGEIPF